MGRFLQCSQLALALVFFSSAYVSSAEDLVLTLTEKNFSETIASHSFVVVEFYAPWCGHCKHLEPEYKKAASVLAEQAKTGKWTGQTITLAKVDATVEKNLGTKYNVRGFPTLKIFESGSDEPSEYEGPRDADGIVSYLKSRAGPPSSEVKTEVEAKSILDESLVVAVYTGSNVDKWMEVARAMRGKLSFVHTSDESIKSLFGVSGEISLVKKFDEKLVAYEGGLDDQDALTQWIDLHRFEVGMFIAKGDQGALKAVFDEAKKPNLFLFLATASTPSGVSSLEEFKNAAKSVRGKYVSGYFEFPNFPEAFEHFGLQSAAEKGQLPAVLIEDRQTNLRYLMSGQKVTQADVERFLEDYREGRLQPHLKTEDVPADNSGPVRVVVGSTFESEVLKAGKWVLLEVYAPWCGHCKKLAPIYEEIGKAFQGSNVVVAKVDATTNDLPPSLGVTGFPTLLLFRGDGSAPETYNGERSWRKITAFVTSWTKVAVPEGYEPPAEMLQESAGGAGEQQPLHVRLMQMLAEDYQVPFMEAGRTVPGLYIFALIIFLLFVASISLVVACLSRDGPAPSRQEAAKGAKKD